MLDIMLFIEVYEITEIFQKIYGNGFVEAIRAGIAAACRGNDLIQFR